MAKLDIDFLRDLQSAGFAEQQAEALIRVIADKTSAHLVTKADLAALKSELIERMAQLETGLYDRINHVESELTGRITKVESSLNDRLATLEARLLKWFIGTAVALAGTVAMIMALVR